METVVSQVVTTKQISNPTTTAGSLRLFFHVCFVSGCDASVLISTNFFNRAEHDADINLSLPVMPSTPSSMTNPPRAHIFRHRLLPRHHGPCHPRPCLRPRLPLLPVPLGRKDSLASTAASIGNQLPRANMTMNQIIASFSAKGFTVREMVTIIGAHTVGFSHCKEFASRIFYFNGGDANSFDPSMDPRYAQALQKACANYKTETTIATFNDVMTPGKFDNIYFQNLERGLALLASDHLLIPDWHRPSCESVRCKSDIVLYGLHACDGEAKRLWGEDREDGQGSSELR